MYRACISLLAVALTAVAAFGERPLLSTAELQQEATHIVVGRVLGVYDRLVHLKGGRKERHFIVEIEVESVKKGERIQKKDLVYARCWQIGDYGPEGPQPGPSGHSLVHDGVKIRAYLVRGKYGATGQKDNGFTAVYPNGFEVIDREKTPSQSTGADER